MQINLLFILLIIMQLKHFIADYPLQVTWMLGKFKPGWDFVLPLLAHVSVHGLITLIICLVVNYNFWWLAILDMVIHFIMDRVKASPSMLGRYKAISASEFKELFEGLDVNNMDEGERKYYNTIVKPAMKNNKYFWWSLGFDQMVHHLTDILVIYILVSSFGMQ